MINPRFRNYEGSGTFESNVLKEMEVNDTDSELSSTPPVVGKAAKETSLRLLPQKSRKKYQAMYQAVMDWRTNKKVKSFSENVFLAYLILKNNPKSINRHLHGHIILC